MSIAAISGLNTSLAQAIAPQNNASSFQTEFQRLGQDLQAGNLPAAQQDFATLQSSQQAPRMHHHHHMGGLGGKTAASDLNQLGDALNAGNLTAAQQAYSALEQVAPFAVSTPAATTAGSGGGVSLTA